MSSRAPRIRTLSASSRAAAALVAIGATLCIGAARGHAQAGARELTLHAGPVYTALPNLRATSRGVGFHTGVHYGVSPWWSVGATAGWAHHVSLPRGESTDPTGGVASLSLGPTLILDVVRIVPFISLHPALHVHDEVLKPEDRVSFAIRGALGFDARIRRQWTVGFEADWHGVFPDAGDYPGYSVFWLRLGYVFETDALR